MDLAQQARTERFNRNLGRRCVSCLYMHPCGYRDVCVNHRSTQYGVVFDHRGKCDFVCWAHRRRGRG